jgi:hypothetical protein
MESDLAPKIMAAGGRYERLKLKYTLDRVYTPDFDLPDGTIIEVKGYFPPADRTKMLAVKAAHPTLDIRMVLATPHAFLTKAKKSTQAMWCEKHGFRWAHNYIPQSWLN